MVSTSLIEHPSPLARQGGRFVLVGAPQAVVRVLRPDSFVWVLLALGAYFALRAS